MLVLDFLSFLEFFRPWTLFPTINKMLGPNLELALQLVKKNKEGS